MPISLDEIKSVLSGNQQQRVESLRQLLGYPLKERDPEGSRFCFLRPGEDEAEAEDTCPIAVGFYAELDRFSKDEILQFLTGDEQQNEIYGHYTRRIIPNQPVMYLLLPEGVEQAIPDKVEKLNGYLHQLLTSFQRELLPTLKLKADNEKDYSFADIYAQTIAYGLFTARVFSYTAYRQQRDERHSKAIEKNFSRKDAWQLLPETNPFLRRLFKDVSQQSVEELGGELADAIAELFSILRAAKMDVILTDFRDNMNREDIVIHFYEAFLEEYNQGMKVQRGVYYTPEPVVSYMVRSVDILLKEKFNKPLGLADPEVMILDPACGTGTFLLWIFQLIHQQFQEDSEALTEGLVEKTWSAYVRERLLPRVFGFELLMAPYAIAHLKLGLFLEETGYQFDSGKRLGVYLTNTLEEAALKSESLFEEFIAEESDQASSIKREKPIMVIVGNPPYSVSSANTNTWITNLVRSSYYPNDEVKEKNPKMLLDDYVKFFRFGQWRINLSEQGILAFISNHGFLDNPTFRGMRQQLSSSFDLLKFYDLHGSIKKKEKSLNGSPDENVFDIQQGVSITFALKGGEHSISHCHLFGDRKTKYDELNRDDINSTDWHSISPQKPLHLFIPQDIALLPEYQQGWKITDAMPVSSSGIKTHRDHFVIDFDLLPLKERIQEFRDLTIPDQQIVAKYSVKDTRDWKISIRRKALSLNREWENFFTKSLYRPFDTRYYYHYEDVVELPRKEVMDHVANRQNICLLTSSRVETARSYDQVLCSNQVTQNHTLCLKEVNYVFPLYLYPETVQTSLQLDDQRRPNFSSTFLKNVATRIGYSPRLESIFYYIYSVLHSPTYRTRYAEFLKVDFPRIPVTSYASLFHQLSLYGEELVALHLMTSPKTNNLITKFEGNSHQVVDPGHPKYDENNHSILINKRGDKFTDVPKEVWEFYIGGYQVCQKWLKDRKGRTLSQDDILHYQRIIVALQETIHLMQKIDAAIPGWPIE